LLQHNGSMFSTTDRDHDTHSGKIVQLNFMALGGMASFILPI